MTFLRDLLHEWAILPSHYDDAFPSGGGSAFAHLSEDPPNSRVVSDWDLLLSGKALLFSDGAGAPDVQLQRANGFNGLLLVDPDYSGFNVSELDDLSTQSSQMTPDTVQAADAGANTYASLNATGQVVISAHSTVRHITVDADGDLAIIGVGKITTH